MPTVLNVHLFWFPKNLAVKLFVCGRDTKKPETALVAARVSEFLESRRRFSSLFINFLRISQETNPAGAS
jgi:hypothetical protein